LFEFFKKLAGQTAVYGLSTIIGRLLNYLLVPFYTRIFLPEEYGVVIELYSYVAFFMILLTYGLETGYFRHTSKVKNENTLYSSLLFFLGISSTLFIALIFILRHKIAVLINYPEQSIYLVYLGIIIGLDAFLALPFAKLRFQNRAFRFVFIKLANISLNVGLNLFFYLVLPQIDTDHFAWLLKILPAVKDVRYVFISNLIASAFTFLLLIPEIFELRFPLDFQLLKKVFSYSFPLLLLGLTGMTMDSLDKILLKYLSPIPGGVQDAAQYALSQVGIYGANFKLAVFMSLFIQAFRFAAEPLFFSHSEHKDAKYLYAAVMKYFVIFGLFIFLGISLYLDIVKNFIDSNYFSGLTVVPWLLYAKLFFGIAFNLSIWYKLSDKTIYGVYISLSGAFVSIALNLILIPIYGFQGAAVTAFFAYLVMIIVSYLLGQKHYPIPYKLLDIFIYFVVAEAIYLVANYFSYLPIHLLFNSFLILAFFIFVVKKEKILPAVMKYYKHRK